jgi:RNA polymerase sporulation-specific sigma factor
MMFKWKMMLQLNLYRILILLRFKGNEIYYIGGSEALPPPLSKEEEEYLLQKLPSGDAATRAMLSERNLRLVVYIARNVDVFAPKQQGKDGSVF